MFKVSITSLVVVLLCIAHLAQASADANLATAVSGSLALSRVKILPIVQNGTSYECYELLSDNQTMKRVHTYVSNLHIIIRAPHLFVKIMVVPSAIEEDLLKDKNLGSGLDLVHANDRETAVLLNHEGVRDQDPRKRKYVTWFKTTDLPDTAFFDDQSKVKGGNSRSGNPLISVKDGTPEGKGGGQNLFYCEDAPKGFFLTGDVEDDFIVIHNAEVKAAPRLLGAEIVTQVTKTDDGQSESFNPDPIVPGTVATVNVDPITKSVEVKAIQKNVDIKVVRLDGRHFKPGKCVKNGGRFIEDVRNPESETMIFGANQGISVYANGQLIYSTTPTDN